MIEKRFLHFDHDEIELLDRVTKVLEMAYNYMQQTRCEVLTGYHLTDIAELIEKIENHAKNMRGC